MSDVNTGSFTRTNKFGDNSDPTFPEFKIEAVLDELATQRAGMPVYRDEERVKIHIPGNSLSIPVEKVNDEHRRRWPEAYKRFRDGLEMSHEGTPLEMWPAITSKSQVLFLKSQDIHTIEQMAQVTDFNLNKLGLGGRQLRALARSFLDSAQRNAMTGSLMKENEKLGIELIDAKKQIEELKNLINGMQVQIEGLASRPNMVTHHVPGQHDPFAGFASPATAGTPTQPASFDPLGSFASRTDPEAA